jgi:hypothetical protein
MATVFWDRRSADGWIHATRDRNNVTSVLRNTKKKLRRLIQNERRGMLISDVELLHDTARPHKATRTRYCWNISTGSCLTNLLTAPTSLRTTTTCLPTRRTGWDPCASTIMSWWKVSKRGWTYRRHTSLKQAYKNLIPRYKCLNSGGDYVERWFKYVRIFFSFFVLLKAHRWLLSG